MEKTADLYPIYGFWHTPWWQTEWFFYTLIIVVILSFLALCWVFFRWLKKRRAQKQPWDIALKRMYELRNKLVHDDQISSKELYLHVTIVLKNYLYGRYGFDVESKTDEELLLFLEHTSLHKDYIHWFREIFENGVRAKFAQELITRSAAANDLQHAIDFVEQTVPKSTRS